MQVDSGSHRHVAISRRTPRFVPFLIALTVCATSAVALGFSAWHLFGKSTANSNNNRSGMAESAMQVSSANVGSLKTSAPGEPSTQPASKTPEPSAPPPGTLFVAGGIVELGGTGTAVPAQKVSIDPFFISETEVTNQQYQEFVSETHHRSPSFWKDGEFPAGAANEPVTGVTWQDAVEYCSWLSARLKETVRLPAEAEWELAARGPNGLKYPWGSEWDDRAAASENHQGFVHSVRSYPGGRSSCGAYDMAGNVWEWIGDVRDSADKATTPEGVKNGVIKGGAANEQRTLISGVSRNLIPKDYSGSFLGFRYVIVRS